MPNCYDCIHRRSIPGDAHSSCAHPATFKLGTDSFMATVALIADPEKAFEVIEELGIKCDFHGFMSGWFMWPGNFDPTWLRACNGFTPKAEKVDAKPSPI